MPKLNKPNLEMNENLAFLIGSIKGDGYVSKDKKYFNNKKKDIGINYIKYVLIIRMLIL